MRLFGYYALHSFVNQIRKLMKTWVLVFFLICLVAGGAIGAGIAFLEDVSEEQNAQEEIAEEVPEAVEAPSFLEDSGLSPMGLFELIAGGLLLAVFVYDALSADKNGGKIFLPADVNLLFPSPMSPQSVLMFRLATQLGAALAMSIYLAFQLPNLILNMGLSVWAALSIIAVWCLTIAFGKLIQVLLYLIGSNHPGFKENLRRIVYAILALIAAGFLLFWKGSGLTPIAAAAAFFNNPVTRFIPLWGWLKAVCLYAMEENTAGALVSLALVLVLAEFLIFLIRRIKADFYEDAMAKSEETAALLEQAQSEKSSGFMLGKRKKDRSDALRRDGMRHGAGANVFFFKSLYNRLRFAHLGFLTKTTETYFVAGVGVSALCRFVLDTRSILPSALALAGLAFFRSLGNPLEQDTKMDFFRMIPENTWAKLFWSLMGGTVNCLLDLLPALIASVLILGANPLLALAWIPFILSIDFYATNVGTFIDLSVPITSGKTIKQLVQILFVYFGLVPDIALMAIGIIFDHTAIAAIGAALLNIGLGFIFFALSPLFLQPGSTPAPRKEEANHAV